MITFRQFIENDEEPFRIILRKSNSNQDNESQKFIKEFISEMGAIESPLEDNTYSYDQDGTQVIFNLTIGINSPNEVILKEIRTNPPATGAGSIFMKKLCKKADESQITLLLQAVPLKLRNRKNIPKTKLIEFYERFGFTKEKDSDNMVRKPK